MEQARDLALAHTSKATQPLPGPICTTTGGAQHVNTFLNEALATTLQVQILLQSIKRTISNYYSLQGNEDLREMVGQHEAVAMEAATHKDEIEAERNSYFTNAVELTTHFREMQDRYKHPQGHQVTSHQQGHSQDTSGTRFIRVPSFEIKTIQLYTRRLI